MDSIILSNNQTIEKIDETYKMVTQIFDDLTDDALLDLMGGYENDFDKMYSDIVNETYKVLYGKTDQIKASVFGYMDKLRESYEEELRCMDLGYFVLSTMPDFKINWHHLEWFSLLQNHKMVCVNAARDHGKSFAFSYALPTWKMYRFNKKSKKRDIQLSQRGYLFSFSKDQAIELLTIMKTGIENNDFLARKLIPTEGKKEVWGKIDITTKNGARLTVRGFGSAVRGAHPGWIIVDDPLKDNVMHSESQRKKYNDYFHSVIMNMPVPGGGVYVVGTPFHNADLYGDLKTKKGWIVLEYPAIFPNGKILWPDRWCLEDLLLKRSTQGNIVFSRELLCRPISSESSIFPYEVIKLSLYGMEEYMLVKNRGSFPVKFDRVVVGCDLALSGNVGSDYSVFCTWGVDKDENMWLINFQRFKGKTYMEQLSILKSINANFQPDVIMMESNQFQMFMVQASENAGLPVKEHTTNASNKYSFKSGIPSLSVMFEKRKFRLPYGNQHSKDCADMFLSEFQSVTFTDKGLQSVDQHDDIPMATWFATLAAKSTQTSLSIGFL